MSFCRKFVLVFCGIILFCVSAAAQGKSSNVTVTAKLTDGGNGEPVSFATVSITTKGSTKPYKYVLSSEDGTVTFEGVRKGTYTFKAELLGYKEYSKEFTTEDGRTFDLGTIVLENDAEQLEAAKVSASGNPVVIKKDTIEYNASSFKTNENAVLEDLLKKLPGIEVNDDGTITSNGQSVSKITIDGKTFFLDDPQVASKNIPAKMVNKLKVIRKKSEQAEFTGIDDGQEETVIDLNVMPDMMKGLIGRATLSGGHDVPSQSNVSNDWRYSGNAFVGSFRDNTQISLILNANNANMSGATNRSGNMMGAMMGGGMGMMMGGGMGGGMMGGGGVTTSYMAGLNAAADLFDERMELGGNYMFNNSNNYLKQSSHNINYLPKQDLIKDSQGANTNLSGGHRFGIRLDHEFSENTSILFEPQINLGTGSYTQDQTTLTSVDDLVNTPYDLSKADIKNSGANKNMSASGRFLLRQKLGIPGRTLTVNANFSYSDNNILGQNFNSTENYEENGDLNGLPVIVDQHFTNNQKQTRLTANATFTEPLGNNFYVDAEYAYTWNRSASNKNTYNKDLDGNYTIFDPSYSNEIINESTQHDIGVNLLYQSEAFRAQLGFSALPTHTFNSTTQLTKTGEYVPRNYVDDRWNFSPRAMLFGNVGENTEMRIFYRGNTQQPSTSQLAPVPDNTDPMNISFGNPSLTPYFTHNVNGSVRLSNRQTFFTMNINLGGSVTQNPIVNATWYGKNGARYAMPFNGNNTANANFNLTLNSPIAKSDFSIVNMTRVNWSKSSTYVGDVDMSQYSCDPMEDYYGFMDEFIAKHPDLTKASDFIINNTNTVRLMEQLRFVYRADALQIGISARTNINKSWYSIQENAKNTLTFNNRVSADFDWTWDGPGLQFTADANYDWYNGYDTEQPSQCIINAGIYKTFGSVTLSLTGNDILGQTRNLTVTDSETYHQESVSNSLGRYIILGVTFNFGSMGGRRGGMGMGRGMGGGMPMGGGRGMGGGMPMGGGRR